MGNVRNSIQKKEEFVSLTLDLSPFLKNLSFFSTHLEPSVQRSPAIHNMLNTKLGCCQNQLRMRKTVQANTNAHTH